jgi:hypothetical protein
MPLQGSTGTTSGSLEDSSPAGSPGAEDIARVDWPGVADNEPLPRDAMTALDRLTQLNGPSPLIAARACGALTVVAATIVTRGYEGLLQLTERLAGELSPETYCDLRQPAEEVAGGGPAATYGALAAFGQALQRRYRGFDDGMPYDQLLHLMGAAGFRPPRSIDDDRIGTTILEAGQCWPAKIAIDGRGDGDHWILVGRDARGLFLYDPYPREDGSQIVRPGEADWKKYVSAIGQDEEGPESIGFLPPE